MQVSVIICTYNRCESLKDTLESLYKQDCNGSFDYEVIVVDNNSNDKTQEIVESYIPKFDKRLRYVFEPKQGLSCARNRGIKEAKGEITAFTDDDAFVDMRWLISLYNTFINYNADCVGGKIVLHWIEKRPEWLTDRYINILGYLNHGDNLLQINSTECPLYGGNIAIRKKKILEYGLFKEDLGRKGNKLLCNEEIEIFRKMISNNERIFYQPEAVVFHKVIPKRMKKKYFRKWFFYSAVSDLTPILKKRHHILGAPLRMYIRLFRNCLRYLKGILILRINKETRFDKECEISRQLGTVMKYILEHKKQ